VNIEIQAKFAGYPLAAVQQLEAVRQLIFAVAAKHKLGTVEESLKWGEASYVVKGGSAIRIDWKPKAPAVIKLYVHCQTCLIATFREIYPAEFSYEGNRAMVIPIDATIGNGPLSHCLQMALQYHSLKHLPLLGTVIKHSKNI